MRNTVNYSDGNTINCKRTVQQKFFSTFTSEEILELPENMPDIEQVVSVISDPEVLSLKVVNTARGTSSEGVYLSGKKAVLEVRLKQKILYVSKTPSRTAHSIENEIYHSIYIVVPPLIEGTEPDILIRYKYLKARASVEDTSVRKTDGRSIFKSTRLFIELYLVPTYELCYSLHSDKSSQIFICCEDGACSTQITIDNMSKNIKPLWSPSGQEIACISDCDGSQMLYFIHIRDYELKRITAPSLFSSIGSYTWSADGESIVFSSCINEIRELFSIDVHSLKYRRLTYSTPQVKNLKPKCSPDGRHIAFLKSISGVTYLYLMGTDGLNSVKIAESTGIKDFDWSFDGKHIAYVRSKGGKADELYLIDIDKSREYILNIHDHDGLVQKRNIQFAPDMSSMAFIGSDLVTEDIFVYDLSKETLNNITDNYKGGQVRDFAWKVDSSKIYYVSNELSYHNIYSINIKDLSKFQLTNITSRDIELDYRPKIK